MIKYNPKSWFKLIFALHKSDTMRILWKEIIYVALFTSFLAYLVINFGGHIDTLSKLVSVYSLIGFVISLLLVFRTNTAYERWWEGRKKWGSLVNDTRNLAIKINTYISNKEDRDYFKRMISNFVFATKEHLRTGVKWEELELSQTELKDFETKKHIPNQISKAMYARLQEIKKSGAISEEEAIILDKNINALLDSLGGCERIKNTPIPYSYMIFLKKFIFIYVTTIPLAFVSIFGYYSAIIATFIFYILVSMEVLAEEIEDPFGTDDNDLPIHNLCEKIKDNLNEILD